MAPGARLGLGEVGEEGNCSTPRGHLRGMGLSGLFFFFLLFFSLSSLSLEFFGLVVVVSLFPVLPWGLPPLFCWGEQNWIVFLLPPTARNDISPRCSSISSLSLPPCPELLRNLEFNEGLLFVPIRDCAWNGSGCERAVDASSWFLSAACSGP